MLTLVPGRLLDSLDFSFLVRILSCYISHSRLTQTTDFYLQLYAILKGVDSTLSFYTVGVVMQRFQPVCLRVFPAAGDYEHVIDLR